MNLLKITTGIIIAAGALAVLWLGAEVFVFTPNVGEKTIRVERGMDVFDVANLLKSEGIIRNRFGFSLYITLTGNLNRLQAGEYVFKGEYALYQVANIISSGLSLSSQKTVIIPEGAAIRQIDAALAGAGVEPIGKVADFKISDFKREFDFLAEAPIGTESLEGFLFPDTYHFEKRSPANIVVRRMLENFKERTNKLRATAGQSKNLYDALVLASILEEEVSPKDMARAAGVLTKRLEAGIPLQVDATLVYALGRPIRRDDIDTLNSPYNTYQRRGLPPTPISNPGLTAIKAALEPEENNFWFYLSRRDNKETIFSRTLEEHETARALYLR